MTIRHLLQRIAKYCLYCLAYDVWLESLHSAFKLETGNCFLSLKQFPYLFGGILGDRTRINLNSDPTRNGSSDSRARRICTQIPWENLSANCHEVTVTYRELEPIR